MGSLVFIVVNIRNANIGIIMLSIECRCDRVVIISIFIGNRK